VADPTTLTLSVDLARVIVISVPALTTGGLFSTVSFVQLVTRKIKKTK